MSSDTLFKIGDKVLINKTKEEGIIKEIVSILGRGDNTYLVSVNNRDRMYSEDNLSLKRVNLDTSSVNLEDIGVLIAIEDKIDEIINNLGLEDSKKKDTCLKNAVKLHAYLTTLKNNNDVKKSVTNNVVLDDLYHGFINSNADFVTYSYMFSEVLKRLGMKALNIGTKDENGEFYVTNLVLIGDKYYYFDVNLEREILNNSFDDELVLCCAALGSDRYSKYFTPLCVLNYNNTGNDVELPKNISSEDINIDFVNSLV